MASKIKVDELETVDGSGTIALQNQLSGMTSASMPTGSILQVLSDELTSTVSSTALVSSDAWTDTGLSIAITPIAASSKIIITGMINTGAGNSGDGMCILRLMRDSTAIAIGDAASNRKRTFSGRGSQAQGDGTILTLPVHWVDSPSTTSAVTYKVQFGIRGTNPNTAYINRAGADTDNTEYQRTASSLSVMEVAG